MIIDCHGHDTTAPSELQLFAAVEDIAAALKRRRAA